MLLSFTSSSVTDCHVLLGVFELLCVRVLLSVLELLFVLGVTVSSFHVFVSEEMSQVLVFILGTAGIPWCSCDSYKLQRVRWVLMSPSVTVYSNPALF